MYFLLMKDPLPQTVTKLQQGKNGRSLSVRK